MSVTSKVRLYDLAKELKLDSKRLIEEVRREGVDVSVPSNSIPKELADKIRNKYFPKKEASAPRAVRVVKKAVRPAAAVATEEAPYAEEDAMAAPVAAVGEQPPQPAPADNGQAAPQPATPPRVIRKLTPAARAEQPAPAVETTSPQAPPVEPDQQEQTVSPDSQGDILQTPAVATETLAAHPAPAADQAGEAAFDAPAQTVEAPRRGTPPPPSQQVRVLRPTAAALNAGVRHGERAPAPVPVAPPATPVTPASRERRERGGGTERERERGGGARTSAGGDRGSRSTIARTERAGTPGETATPQTLYTPPPDARRRGRSSRTSTARGGHKAHDNRSGRFDDRDVIRPPRAMSLEDRIAGRLDVTTVGSELKPVRLVEGSTVKEFAEKLGIKPKDVVTLLLQRGVFATINQPLNDDVAVDLGRRYCY